MVRGGRAGLLVLLPACAPWRYVDVVCDAAPPPEGQVLVQTLSCAEQIPDEGEGRVGADLYVATAYARGVLRHPQDALTLSDTGGLTLIDWAPWGEADVLHELVPLVGGGWVRPETWTLGPAEVEVRGPVGPLPDDAPVRALGQETTVRWVFDPERPCVRAEGADGWWLHGAGAVVRHGRSLQRGDVAIVSTGEVVHDLGGALRLGEGELCIGSPVEAWSAVGTQALEGISDGEVELASATGLVGRLPRGTVDARVPSDVREVRAVANDAAPGPWHPVGTDILLATGPRGSVELELPADGRARWVHWEHADGRTGTVAVDEASARIGTGAGLVTLRVSGGPAETSETVMVDVPSEGVAAAVVLPTPRIERDGWALVGIGLPSDRSRHWRGGDRRALREGRAQGLDYLAFLVDDGTTELLPGELGQPRAVAHGGSRYRGASSGAPWQVDAWPVRVSEKKNAWGTLQYPVDSPNQALQLAQGGAGRLRNLAVDLATLEQLGAPHAVDAPPNLVHLGPPGDLSSWRPWFRWLDAAAVVGPAGPLTWVPVPARDQLTAAEVDAKLRRGSAVAGTGERLWLRVDGLHPGDAHLPIVDTASLAPTGPTADTGTALTTPSAEPLLLTVDAITSGLDRVRILGDGGRVLYDAPEPPEAWAVPADAGRWVLALGTGPGEAWAVTGPIWIAPPR